MKVSKKLPFHFGLICLCCLVLMLQFSNWMEKGCAAHTLNCKVLGESVGRKTKEGKVYYNFSSKNFIAPFTHSRGCEAFEIGLCKLLQPEDKKSAALV